MEQSNENENIISTKNETCEVFFNDVPMGNFFEHYPSLEQKIRCSHNNTYHSECNTCLIFSCFKVVIIKFLYMVIFLIYHGNM